VNHVQEARGLGRFDRAVGDRDMREGSGHADDHAVAIFAAEGAPASRKFRVFHGQLNLFDFHVRSHVVILSDRDIRERPARGEQA
jgi:hypothetical protein